MVKKELDLDTKIQKVLKYLLNGQKIKYDNAYYAMNSDYRVGICTLDEKLKPENRVLETGGDGLGVIVMLAKNLSDEELFSLGADAVLNELNYKERGV